MRTVTAEFRTPGRPSKVAWTALGALTLFAIASWAVVVFEATQTRKARAEIARMKAAETEAKSRATVVPRPPPWDASARAMLELAGLRWPDALTVLENVQKNGVVPTALSISVPAKTIAVELTFADYPALLEYIEQLNMAGPGMGWRLVQAQAEPATASAAGLARPITSRATIAATLVNR